MLTKYDVMLLFHTITGFTKRPMNIKECYFVIDVIAVIDNPETLREWTKWAMGIHTLITLGHPPEHTLDEQSAYLAAYSYLGLDTWQK